MKNLRLPFAILLLICLTVVFVGCSTPPPVVDDETFNSQYKDWQSGIKDDAKLTEVVMPGSHDAGSADLDGSSVAIANGFLMCQNLSIYYQLLSGSRYFDLRTMLDEGELYIQHGDLKVQKFITVVEDIKRYISEENDFLVLNFQHFTDDEAATATYEVLKQHFDLAKLCVPTNEELGKLTFKDVRDNGWRFAIIWGRATIPDNDLMFKKDNEFLYSPYDGDIHSESDDALIAHFADYIAGSDAYNGFFNLQCQRTWSSAQLLKGPEQLEEEFAPKADEFISNLTGDDLAKINIIHRDFINPDKCGVILQLNVKKGLVKQGFEDKF